MGIKSFHLLHCGTSYGGSRLYTARKHRAILQSGGVGQFHSDSRVLRRHARGGKQIDQQARTASGGAPVFRTTRSVKVTNEGELFWKECQLALEQIAEAERAITGAQTVPSGLLRISVSTAYGTHRLLPLMPRFTEAYPQIEIELSISDKIVDFVEEGYDIAIRLGIQRDSRLVAYKLEDALLGDQ